MIRLDAATVLLQWSVGGLFFLWFTTRRREVGLGYGWLLRGTYLLMALGGFAAGVAFGYVPVRDTVALVVALVTLAVLIVSIRRKDAGVSGADVEHDRRTARVAAMTGIERDGPSAPREGLEFPPVLDLVAPAIGLVGLLSAGVDASTGGAENMAVALLRTVVGAALGSREARVVETLLLAGFMMVAVSLLFVGLLGLPLKVWPL